MSQSTDWVDLTQQVASLGLLQEDEGGLFDDQGIRCVTISHALNAKISDAKSGTKAGNPKQRIYVLGGKPFRWIETVAIVFEITQESEKIKFDLRDDTGRIKGSIWATTDVIASYDLNLKELDYVRVIGELETIHGHNYVRISQIRRVDHYHEVYHHLLSVLYEVQCVTKGPPSLDERQNLTRISHEPKGKSVAKVEKAPTNHSGDISSPSGAMQDRRPETPVSSSTSSLPRSPQKPRSPQSMTPSKGKSVPKKPVQKRDTPIAKRQIKHDVPSSPSSSDSDEPSITPVRTRPQYRQSPRLLAQGAQRAGASNQPEMRASTSTPKRPNPTMVATPNLRTPSSPVSSSPRSQKTLRSRQVVKPTPTEKAILAYLAINEALEDGCCLKDIVDGVIVQKKKDNHSVSQDDFMTALQNLLEEGNIYSTIDDHHYKSNYGTMAG